MEDPKGDRRPMGDGTKDTPWFKEHRDYFVSRVVQDFFKASDALEALEIAYSKKAPIYVHLCRLVGDQQDKGILWHLKDRCHQLWRNVDPEQDSDPFFFDWMIGTMFHEAMKLKENAYMIERYAPSYEVALGRVQSETQGDKCRRFFNETVKDVKRGIERIRCLFSNAAQRLRHLVKRERENGVLLRLILEEQARAERLLMETGQSLLSWLFPEGIHYAYLVAGESYLEGGWYAEARLSFEEALRLEPHCHEARAGLMLLEKRLKDITLYGPGPLVLDEKVQGLSLSS